MFVRKILFECARSFRYRWQPDLYPHPHIVDCYSKKASLKLEFSIYFFAINKDLVLYCYHGIESLDKQDTFHKITIRVAYCWPWSCAFIDDVNEVKVSLPIVYMQQGLGVCCVTVIHQSGVSPNPPLCP